MSFIRRPPSFAYCSHNLSASTPVSTPGTAVTAGANNADGSAVSALTALTHDCEYLVVVVQGFSLSTANSRALLDILVDPAGGTSWVSLIDDLLAGFTAVTATGVPAPLVYHFPVWIKAGSTVGLRARTAHTADITTGTVALLAHGGNRNPGSWWCGQKVQSIGIDPTNSKGTDHTPGTSSSFSTWTNFGSVLDTRTNALQFAVGGSDANALTAIYHMEFGVSSQRIGAPVLRTTTTLEFGWQMPTGPVFNSLPAGAQLMVRGVATAATVEIMDVAAYAVQ